MWPTFVTLCLGIGLSASCGFRVFVPLLVISVAAKADMLTLAGGFEWIESWPALGALSLATVLEIGAYYLPWLDNLLDSIAGPAAVVAGIVATAACVADMDPLLQWSVAVIAGGGTAGTIKLGAAGIRLGSSLLTGGMANSIFSTIEWISALVLSILAVLLPILAAAIGLVLTMLLARFAWRFVASFRRNPSQAGKNPAGPGE